MTKYVIDAGVAIRLAAEGAEAAAGHALLAPTLIRSQVLSLLHESVARGEISAQAGLDRHRRFSAMPIRLLGDAVLRRRAWEVADRLGWVETYAAEYVALTQLRGDAFVTLDDDLAKAAAELVEVAGIDALRRP